MEHATDVGSGPAKDMVWAADADGSYKGEPTMLVLLRRTYEDLKRKLVVFECSTWGELRERLDHDVYVEVCELAGYGSFAGYTKHLGITGVASLPNAEAVAADRYDPDAEIPADDQPFNASDDISAAADGDWPPSVEYLMGFDLPPEIIQRYGRRSMTVLSGEFVDFDPAQQDDILRDLESLGYNLTEEPDLLTLFQ